MLYLSGSITPISHIHRHDLGGLITFPQKYNPDKLCPWLKSHSWAADNGCFTNPKAFSEGAYSAWLNKYHYAFSTCLFATAPDVVGDAVLTWERSRSVLPVIRRLGLPAAFIAQDGIDLHSIFWGAFDTLFIGGTTDFKLSPLTAELVGIALKHKKWVHMGRVNSYKRLSYAHRIGCHSVDGTYIKFGPNINIPKLTDWLDRINVP